MSKKVYVESGFPIWFRKRFGRHGSCGLVEDLTLTGPNWAHLRYQAYEGSPDFEILDFALIIAGEHIPVIEIDYIVVPESKEDMSWVQNVNEHLVEDLTVVLRNGETRMLRMAIDSRGYRDALKFWELLECGDGDETAASIK